AFERRAPVINGQAEVVRWRMELRKPAGRSARGHAQHRESAAPVASGRRRPRRTIAAAVASSLLAFSVGAGAAPVEVVPLQVPGVQVPPALEQLAQQRDAIARDLSETIARCVERHDTAHPAFHGCVDWHSAVHGVWALVAYVRATGDERFRPLIDETLR